MKPDFVVIGGMKCGSSTISAFLEDHPQVFMAPGCEPNFFSHDDNFRKGPGWYATFFRDRSDQTIVGEGSNAYANSADFPWAASRMAVVNPDMKIIYMVRDPIERIRSEWIQRRVDAPAHVPVSPDLAVAEMEELFLAHSRYWTTLSFYRSEFPDSQIFVGFMEDLAIDKEGFFDRLTNFLGVSPMKNVPRPHVNRSAGKRVPAPLYSILREVPLARQLHRVLPEKIRSFVRDLILTRPATNSGNFSAAVLNDLRAQLAEDSFKLLDFCGKPRDFWPIGRTDP